ERAETYGSSDVVQRPGGAPAIVGGGNLPAVGGHPLLDGGPVGATSPVAAGAGWTSGATDATGAPAADAATGAPAAEQDVVHLARRHQGLQLGQGRRRIGAVENAQRDD